MSYYQTNKTPLYAVSVLLLLTSAVLAEGNATLWKTFESRAAVNSRAAWNYYRSLSAVDKLECTVQMASKTQTMRHQESAYMLFVRMIDIYADTDGADVAAVTKVLDDSTTPNAWKTYLFETLSSRQLWRGNEEAFQSKAIEIGLTPTTEYALRSVAASYACRVAVRICAHIAATHASDIDDRAGTFEAWVAHLSDADGARGKEQSVRIHKLLAAVPAIIKEKEQGYHMAYGMCAILGTGNWVNTDTYVSDLKQMAAGEHDESAVQRARAAACVAILDPKAIEKEIVEAIDLSSVDEETRRRVNSPDVRRYSWSERALRSAARTQATTRPATTAPR